MKYHFSNLLNGLLTVFFAGLTSCASYNQVLKTNDYEYKYEAAKQYYAEGQYNRASLMLSEVISVLKGTYPKGKYTAEARYNCGVSLYKTTPEPKLDQTATYEAVTEFQNFIENYPTHPLRAQAQDYIFQLQDKLVEKEYLSAKLYFDLGPYIGNGVNGNYGACIITAENAIKDFPYTTRREDFSILILRAKFALAELSVESKKEDRFHQAIDEYYSFVTEYPESKYLSEAKKLFQKAKPYMPKETEQQ